MVNSLDPHLIEEKMACKNQRLSLRPVLFNQLIYLALLNGHQTLRSPSF